MIPLVAQIGRQQQRCVVVDVHKAGWHPFQTRNSFLPWGEVRQAARLRK